MATSSDRDPGGTPAPADAGHGDAAIGITTRSEPTLPGR